MTTIYNILKIKNGQICTFYHKVPLNLRKEQNIDSNCRQFFNKLKKTLDNQKLRKRQQIEKEEVKIFKDMSL